MINVSDILYLTDVDGTPLMAVVDKTDLTVDHIADTSSVLDVSVDLDFDIKIEQGFIYRGERYTIKEIEEIKNTRERRIMAEISYLDLADDFIELDLPPLSLYAVSSIVLARTGWTVGTIFDNPQKHTIVTTDSTPLAVLRLLCELSGLALDFDTLNKTVSFVEKVDKNVGFLLRYRKNVEDIKKLTIAPKATVLYPFGSEGLTIESVNDGEEYIEDFSWYVSQGYPISLAREVFRKVKKFEDSRIVSAEDLKRRAIDELSSLSQPQIAYTVTVSNISDSVKIGDFGYVVDEELDIKVNVRVVRLVEHEYYQDSEVELNYLVSDLSTTILDNNNNDDKGEVKTVMAHNKQLVDVVDVNIPVAIMDITNLSSDNMLMNIYISGQANNALLLDGYIDIDGVKLPQGIKQNVGVGYHTIGIPILASALQQGSHTIRLILKTDSPTNKFTIDKEQAVIIAQSRKLAGGMSSGVPRFMIIEDVKFEESLAVTDSCTVVLGV